MIFRSSLSFLRRRLLSGCWAPWKLFGQSFLAEAQVCSVFCFYHQVNHLVEGQGGVALTRVAVPTNTRQGLELGPFAWQLASDEQLDADLGTVVDTSQKARVSNDDEGVDTVNGLFECS